jgi:hypothetical protein
MSGKPDGKPPAAPSGRRIASVEEIMEELKPLYPGIDMAKERLKIARWQQKPRNSRRKITRNFLINWLSKSDEELLFNKQKPKHGPEVI